MSWDRRTASLYTKNRMLCIFRASVPPKPKKRRTTNGPVEKREKYHQKKKNGMKDRKKKSRNRCCCCDDNSLSQQSCLIMGDAMAHRRRAAFTLSVCIVVDMSALFLFIAITVQTMANSNSYELVRVLYHTPWSISHALGRGHKHTHAHTQARAIHLVVVYIVHEIEQGVQQTWFHFIVFIFVLFKKGPKFNAFFGWVSIEPDTDIYFFM